MSPRNEPLHLTPLILRGEIGLARSLCAVDPKLFCNVSSYSGFITVNEPMSWHYYFWFFPIEDRPLDCTPWVIWLQGGPGVSSLYGLFTELGPLYVQKNGRVSRMPVTWSSDYSLLFIDNPIQTGFSYSDRKHSYITNEAQVAVSLVSFVQQFVQLFPELRQAPLFIAGQSFAGKYIPAFALYLHHHQDSEYPINLRGLILGNGYIDPPNMMHLSELGMQLGFIDPDDAMVIEQMEDSARTAWNNDDDDEFWERACFANMTAYRYFPSFYNYLEDSSRFGQQSYDFFLARPDIRRALHVGNIDFKGNNFSKVSEHFEHITYITAKPWLEELLEHYGVLCYNYVKAAGNFMEVMIRAAGHKAPHDQPLATKQVVDMFIDKFKTTARPEK